MAGLPKLIVIVGTNASGKSSLGVALAARFGGEVISADSRQVYRGLDLGSGKITPEEMGGVPHHLIDVCQPGDFFSMADFQRLAFQAAEEITARGRLPFLVGGTGLYVDAVADGYVLSDKAPDLALRGELEKLETPVLYARLKAQIPDTPIDPRNRNRVMRALERLAADDYHPDVAAPRYEVLKLGVTWERAILKERIHQRLETRLRQGMIQEVQNLISAGVSTEFLLKLGLEYRYICRYLMGGISYNQMTDELERAICRFAKRQMTWFRRDSAIHWLAMAQDPLGEAAGLIESFGAAVAP